MSQSPSSSVNTYISASRNTFLLSSIALACFTTAKAKNFTALIPCALVALVLAIANGCISINMFEKFVRKVRGASDMVSHPATDFEAWNSYIVQLKVYVCMLTLVLVAMVFLTLFKT